VHCNAVRRGQAHEIGIDLIPTENPQPLRLLAFVSHGDPGVRNQHIRILCCIRRLDQNLGLAPQPSGLLQYPCNRLVAWWRGHGDLQAQYGCGQNQGVADIVSVPDPGQLEILQPGEALANGLQVGQNL